MCDSCGYRLSEFWCLSVKDGPKFDVTRRRHMECDATWVARWGLVITSDYAKYNIMEGAGSFCSSSHFYWTTGVS